MSTEKRIDYFIARYSLIPDMQIDLETAAGITKEDKFMDWLHSFEVEKHMEAVYNGNTFVLYCKELSSNRFFMSFAKKTYQMIGEKTDNGIISGPVDDYKKCNIFINTASQFFIIEKNFDMCTSYDAIMNAVSNVITSFLKKRSLYFQLNLLTEKNDFWEYVAVNSGNISEIEIKLTSPNLLRGIVSVSDFLHQTHEQYNNTDFSFKLSNDEGKLNVNPDNPFLQDAIRYSSAGCGTWKAKTKNSSKWYSNTDNPILIKLPVEVEHLKDSDRQNINSAFEKVKNMDPEQKEG